MIAAILQARMGSSRLPGKVLLDLHGKPVLWHVINRVSQSTRLDQVIVATTNTPEDDAIVRFCERDGFPCFRGSENDVLDRFYQCAKKFGITHIVRVTADCPLHDPHIIDYAIDEYLKGGYDYVTNTLEYTYPDGLDVEVFSFEALESAWKNAHLGSEREHVTPNIRNSPRFRKKNVAAPEKYPLYRLTLDNREDYRFISAIFSGIGKDAFGLDEVVTYINKNPGLLEINQHIGLNEGYLKSLIQDAKTTELETPNLLLRPLVPDDASERYCEWLNDSEVNRHLETKQISLKELRDYIAEKHESPECIFLGIFSKETKKHIGNIKLEPISYAEKTATIGILIGDKNSWGKGICTEAITAVVEYALSTLGLHKISLGVVSENLAAIKCYERAGFTLEKREVLTGVNAATNREKIIMSVNKTGNKTEVT
jgi:spore coat polysaccharide biosynthesis protein SpsF